MLDVVVIGASGYTGCELVQRLLKHEHVNLKGLYVSEHSEDKGKKLSDLYGRLLNQTDLTLEPLSDPCAVAKACDVVFMCTEHKVSHDLAPIFYKEGCHIFDLSGAFRVNDSEFYTKYYGFTHEHQDLLDKAVYALCEWVDIKELQESRVISLPGCYPTAAQLALRPLIEAKLLDLNFKPIINAISGVSGAGRKAKITSSFCEVSTNAYGIFTHRHLPEIQNHLNTQVIFNPHLGNFKRGILETISAKLNANVSEDDINASYHAKYADCPLVRLRDTLPSIKDVENTPFCDISFQVDDGYIVVCSAIDNLLKGAATQAIQALNLHFNFKETTSLI